MMLSICIIGAGFSGICAGVKLKSVLSQACSFTVFDENEDFGGVWLKNSYPGCACEVPSHLYCFSFEPNPEWSQHYCQQPEILAYLQRVAKKHDLYSHAKFNHRVNQIKWDEESLKWEVEVQDKVTTSSKVQEFDIVIVAQGRFSSPEIPRAFREFQGPIVHTASWNHEVALNGTVLAVGCGASGAQVIPEIARKVDHLLVYQRHAPWVIPRINFSYPGWIKWTFSNVPGVQRLYLAFIFWLFERNRAGLQRSSIANKLAPWLSKFHLWKQVRNPKTREKLVPDYRFGCKRIVNSSEYYKTFNLPNVTIINSEIKVTKDGLITEDGEKYELDFIVLATGFQVQNFFATLSVIGRNGINISEMWTNTKPTSYLSIVTASAPNFFFLLGPNASTGYTSIIIQLEAQVEWVLKAIQRLLESGNKAMVVKPIAEAKYMTDITSMVKKTVFGSTQCANSQSWYLNPRGDVVEIYPDSTHAYKIATSEVVLEDFEFYK